MRERLDKFLYELPTDDPIYHATKIAAQDKFACISQGIVTDRTQEHLGWSDKGVALLRRLFREAANEVLIGGNPRGVLRDTPPGILHFSHS